jgi:hypothetical protein
VSEIPQAPEPNPGDTLGETVRPFTFDHIPQLRELMPTTGGIPGVTYLQCTLGNLRKAQDKGWGGIVGGSKVYTVVGPKGSADLHLLCKGKPIPGGDIHSGARKCFVDDLVEDMTGLFIEPPEVPPSSVNSPLETAARDIEKAVKDKS